MIKILLLILMALPWPANAEPASGTIAASGSQTIELSMPMLQQEGPVVKFVMKKMRVPHCKRGPQRCEICRIGNVAKWCLLDVDPPDQDRVQRPVLEFVCQGERLIRVFDVLKSFVSKEEAEKFLSVSDYPGLIWDSAEDK